MLAADTGARLLAHERTHTCMHTHTLAYTHMRHKANASALEEFMLSEVDSGALDRQETVSGSNQEEV